MKVEKVFNNNVVLICAGEREMIVLGTGIGFKKKFGDEIDESLIVKKFILEEKNIQKKLLAYLKC